MKYAYYPGCSLHSTANEYNETTEMVCKKLGITLEEIPNWVCCGASSGHSLSHLGGLALPAHTLVKAEEMGLDILAPCAACYARMITTAHEMKHNDEMKQKIDEVVGKPFNGTIGTKSILEVIESVGLDQLTQAVQKPLAGLKVACYYGCLLVKPPKIVHSDDDENPMSMDRILRALGAETVEWPYKTECCGGSLLLSNTEIVYKLCRDIMQFAVDAGANCLAVARPKCQANLDMPPS